MCLFCVQSRRALTTAASTAAGSVDSIGLGAVVVDILKSKGWPLREFNASNRSSEPDRFLNVRAESHWRFREMLENDRVAIAHSSTLNEECAAIEWFTSTFGQIQILGKDTIRAPVGRSPDTLDSVVMALCISTNTLRRNTVTLSTFNIG